MNLASKEMLNTLETLADKLSTGNHQNQNIIFDNNGNKLNCKIDKVKESHQKESAYHGSNKTSCSSLKYFET
jgi:hypothetical protein